MSTVTIANADASLSGKTLMTTTSTDTVTGAKTFDRDPSPPFVVTSGSGNVPNLDADLLDGLNSTDFALIAGTNTLTGANTFTNALSVSADWYMKAAITPSALANGDNNNFTATGIASANRLRLTPDAGGSALTGLVASTDGRVMWLQNLSNTVDITLKVENASSTAANRFAGGSNVTLVAGRVIGVMYDATLTRWQIRV